MLERRLSLRLLAYWERARGMRLMPQESDIHAANLSDIWDDCFILQVVDQKRQEFAPLHCGANLQDTWLEMVHLKGSIATLLAKKGPVLEDGMVYDEQGQVVKYRQCLLPLGDGSSVSAILGGARFKTE
jgi:hypothetical protein